VINIGFFKFIGRSIKSSINENLEQLENIDKCYICNKCSYKWKSKKTFGEPSICPKCNSRNIKRYYKKEDYKGAVVLEFGKK